MNTQDQIIFIVDDDRRIREALAMLLSTFDLRVVTFGSAAEYIAYAKPDVPTCLILDVELPDINGLEVQAVLRKDSPETRVIFISGRDDPSVRQAAIAAGAFGFLSKPFDDEALLALVRKAIAN